MEVKLYKPNTDKPYNICQNLIFVKNYPNKKYIRVVWKYSESTTVYVIHDYKEFDKAIITNNEGKSWTINGLLNS